MTEREKLQYCYELAFYPPRLHEASNSIKNHPEEAHQNLGEMLDTAQLLHLALPETGFSSQRALNRLAQYQANARAFGMVSFLRNLRKKLNRPPLKATCVPPCLVRDIGLPALARR